MNVEVRKTNRMSTEEDHSKQERNPKKLRHSLESEEEQVFVADTNGEDLAKLEGHEQGEGKPHEVELVAQAQLKYQEVAKRRDSLLEGTNEKNICNFKCTEGLSNYDKKQP